MVNGYMTVQEAAEKWGVSQRQVQVLCKSGRIPGVSRFGRSWIIPEAAVKPTYTYLYDKEGKVQQEGTSKERNENK